MYTNAKFNRVTSKLGVPLTTAELNTSD